MTNDGPYKEQVDAAMRAREGSASDAERVNNARVFDTLAETTIALVNANLSLVEANKSQNKITRVMIFVVVGFGLLTTSLAAFSASETHSLVIEISRSNNCNEHTHTATKD